VQVVLEKYVRYPRADGHTIWASDPWVWKSGRMYSAPVRIDWDPRANKTFSLELNKTVEAPPQRDTQWIKYVRIKSMLLSRFWGRDMFLTGIVLLPKGYEQSGTTHYPVIYSSNLDPPFDFATSPPSQEIEEKRRREYNGGEDGYKFFQSWN